MSYSTPVPYLLSSQFAAVANQAFKAVTGNEPEHSHQQAAAPGATQPALQQQAVPQQAAQPAVPSAQAGPPLGSVEHHQLLSRTHRTELPVDDEQGCALLSAVALAADIDHNDNISWVDQRQLSHNQQQQQQQRAVAKSAGHPPQKRSHSQENLQQRTHQQQRNNHAGQQQQQQQRMSGSFASDRPPPVASNGVATGARQRRRSGGYDLDHQQQHQQQDGNRLQFSPVWGSGDLQHSFAGSDRSNVSRTQPGSSAARGPRSSRGPPGDAIDTASLCSDRSDPVGVAAASVSGSSRGFNSKGPRSDGSGDGDDRSSDKSKKKGLKLGGLKKLVASAKYMVAYDEENC